MRYMNPRFTYFYLLTYLLTQRRFYWGCQGGIQKSDPPVAPQTQCQIVVL